MSTEARVALSGEILWRIRRAVKYLASDVCELACELSGFGPYAEGRISDGNGLGVETRLIDVHEALRKLLEQLRAARGFYLSAQLKAAGISDDSTNLRLHIGCRSQCLRGWINVDTYPAPLAMSALWDLPFASGSVTYTFISRMPSLLFFPMEIRRFLSEVRRVLIPGGLLRIAVANSEAAASSTHAAREAAYRAWACELADRTRIDHLLGAFGAALDPKAADHQGSGFNVDALMHLLADEGYTDVALSRSSASADKIFGPDFEDPIHTIGSGCGSLSYLEARKSIH